MIAAFLIAATCVCGLDHEVANERCEILWSGETVGTGQVSRAVAVDGFRSRSLYLVGEPDFRAEIDDSGDGNWREVGLKKRSPGVYDLRYLTGSVFRVVAGRDATNVTAVVALANPSFRPDAAFAKGGPWNESEVKAGEPSDPFPIHGFGDKYLTVASDVEAKITVELDITGTGVWIPFRTFKTADRLNFSNLRAFRLRAVADRDCRATVQIEYR